MKSNKVSLWFSLFLPLSLVFTHYSLCFESHRFPFGLYTLSTHSVLHFNCITFLLRCRKQQTEREGGWRFVRINILFFSLLFFLLSLFSLSETVKVYNREHNRCSWFSSNMQFPRRLKILLMIIAINLTFDVRLRVAHLRLLEFLKQIAHCCIRL